MASNDPAHRSNRSTNAIPLQDLDQNGGASQERGLGIPRHESHRRTISDRVAGYRSGRRPSNARSNRQYARISARSQSPPTRDLPISPIAFVTSPSGENERIPDEDDEVEISPVEDRGAFQAAIGFAGLSFNTSQGSTSSESEEVDDETPSRAARASRVSLPSLRTNRDSLDEMDTVQLDDGPAFFSPGDRDEEDTLPLTSPTRLQPSPGRHTTLTSNGQSHDRSRASSQRSSRLSVRFAGRPSRSGSRLGDDLRNMEAGSHTPDSRHSRSPSSHHHSLSPSSAESPLARTGTMLRKMSQRVVNMSNDQVDNIVSREIRQKSSQRGAPQVEEPRPSTAETSSTDFGALDGASRRNKSDSSEKASLPRVEPDTPRELPKIDRNPLRGKSLGIFSPESRVRRKLLEFLVNPLVEMAILVLIVIQAIILAVDSAKDVYANPRPAGWGSWSDIFLFVIFAIYTIEIVIKIIVSGFVFNPVEYSTIDRSVGVRQALIKKANDLFALERKPSAKDDRDVNERPSAAPSLLRSFTAEGFDDIPGSSRQAAKKRLAHRAFLRHSYNRVDFVAVVSFWIHFLLNRFTTEIEYHIYVFQMMSCLRTLRLLSVTSGTSVILRSLKRAAPTLLNVAFLIGFFWLLFAIVGVQSFKASLRRTCVWDGSRAFPPQPYNYTQNYAGGNGNIQYCGGWRAENGSMMPWLMPDGGWGAKEHKGYVCPVGSFCVQDVNPYDGTVSFDNIVNAIELVFIILSTNTFSDIMYDFTNTDYLAAALFFAFGIIVLTFWLINLLIAVITSSFQVIREESRASAFMAEDTDTMEEKTEEAAIEHTHDHTSARRESPLKRLYQKSKWIWIGVIVYGLLVNATRNATMGDFVSNFIIVSELLVSLVLLVEIIIRFVVDWRGFIRHYQNWFDLSLAIITTVMEIPHIRHAYNGQAYAWLTVFQIMRVYRVVLAISITRELILLVLKHVSGVLNLILFVFLLTFLASLFAVQLFRGEIPREQPSGATIYVTFSTIFNAYLGMYQILSSENWTDILFNVTASEVKNKTSWIGATFLCLWFVFAFFITLNLFIAVIQENFDVSEDQKRLQQVRMLLQQKELGTSEGSLSLSTIFKFGRVRKQDPLDFGNAATDMLLKDGIVREFLDEEDVKMFPNGALRPGISGASTFDLLQGKQVIVTTWWKKLLGRIFNNEPNPFHSSLQLTKAYEQIDPRTLAQEVVSATERRKVTQREYLRRHPKYNVSLFIFTPDHPIRRACMRIVGPGRRGQRIEGRSPNTTVWYAFSACIYLAIVAMVLLACVTTPLYQLETYRISDKRLHWFVWCDMAFAILFSVEASIKVIADGFWWTPHAYFRSSWGFIDGVVLVTLWINVVTSLYDPGGGSRAVGAFKALRALRLLNVSDSARDTFHSVIVIGGWKVISAAFVSLSLLIPFAIYGLNLFAGRMSFCNQPNGSGNPIDSPINVFNLTDCVGEFYYTAYNWEFPAPRQVRNSWYDFDNFGNSLFILFQIVSQEGWVSVMWSAQSITGVFKQPANFVSQGNAVFFVIFNLLGAVFVLTLFVSVFMRNYTEQTGVAFLTTEQRSWLELRKLLRQVAPSKRPNSKRKRENWQEWCYRRAVTKTGRWQRLITAVLIFHLILLCLEWYPEPAAWARTRDYIYLTFTIIYIANIIVRIIGLSWTRFRKSAWDVYSVFAVAGTFATTVLLLSNFEQRLYIQLHKLFLVSIALLLIPRNNQLDQLFKTAAASFTAIANLLATWFVLFLVYAIAMTQAFGLTRFYWNEDDNINFRTVPKALILLFRMSVGENWNQIMEDFARVVPPYCNSATKYLEGDCGSPEWARALFISWNILSMYIFVNLFVSLIYESFSYVYQRSSGLSVISREEIRRFKQAWAEFDPNGTGYISKEVFPKFLGELSGVFEMRIYDGDFSVRTLIEDCTRETPRRSSALPVDGSTIGPYEIDLPTLNRRLAELPVDQIRRRRARMNTFYEEVQVSADPDRGISFNALLMILAHYKVINDNKSLKLEEFLRRKARLQRVEEAVSRNIVVGFFDTWYWARRFKQHKERKKDARVTVVSDLGVPEIFVQDESDDVSQAKKFDIPSVAVTPVEYEAFDTADSLGLGRAPSIGSDMGNHERPAAASMMRNRSGSIQSSVPSSPTAERHLSTQHRPSASISSIQPDWHVAAALETSPGVSPPTSPGLLPTTIDGGSRGNETRDATAARSRANSAISQHEMMGMFQDSAWGQSMRRSFTQRRPSQADRRPSS